MNGLNFPIFHFLFVNNNIHIVTIRRRDDVIFSYDKRTGDGVKLDYYVPGQNRLIGADSNNFYFRTDDNTIYKVDTNGDSKLLLCSDDIDNIDGRKINISAIEYKTSAISPDGTIYYWDINYNSIRQLSSI